MVFVLVVFHHTLKATQISHVSDRNEGFDPADKMKRQPALERALWGI